MKGQTMTEYLHTFAWALVVIIVVGTALYFLGVLNPTTYETNYYKAYSDSNYHCISSVNTTARSYDLEGCFNLTQHQDEAGRWYCMLPQIKCDMRERNP